MDKIVISRSKMIVTLNNKVVDLAKREFDLLWFFANNKDKAITRKEIISSAWEHEHVVDRTVDVHITKLRNKLGKETIKTILKGGYRFDGNIKIENNSNEKQIELQKNGDDIIINGSYHDNDKNTVVVTSVADSKFGRLVIFVGLGDISAMAIKDFKSIYKLI